MPGRFRKLATGLGVLLLVWMVESEVQIRTLTREFQPLVRFNTLSQIPEMEAQEQPWPGQDGVVAVMGWSAGSATYFRLELRRGEKVLLNFWATDSVMESPEIWVEPAGRNPSRLLTYQPLAYPSVTPNGNTRFGFYLWTFEDGQYRFSKVAVCPLNLWIRNPLPFQN